MRTFEQTHSWLKFAADLHQASPSLWIALGECQSKCEHISRVPLRPDTAEQLYKLYLAKGAAATTAIEGNSLSEEQVRQHLEGKLKLPPSQQYLQKEVDNIIQACNAILKAISDGKDPSLDANRMLDLNRRILEGLSLEPEVKPGEIRTHSVLVGRYRGAPAEDCDFLLTKLAEWLSGDDFKPAPGLEIAYATLKAVVAHLYLAWIHPFGDGNGRTARLIEFQILITSGVPAPAAHLLSNHYNQTRAEYYRKLDNASRSGGDILPFVTYAAQGFLDGLTSQLEFIWAQQWDVIWRNYVHEMFRERAGHTHIRRRHLVLDLSRVKKPVSVSEITQISTRIAEAYARKTRKTLMRDLNELERMNLVERGPEGYRARSEQILAFLPPKASRPKTGDNP